MTWCWTDDKPLREPIQICIIKMRSSHDHLNFIVRNLMNGSMVFKLKWKPVNCVNPAGHLHGWRDVHCDVVLLSNGLFLIMLFWIVGWIQCGNPQGCWNFRHAPLNSQCFLANDMPSSFPAFSDKLLIWVTTPDVHMRQIIQENEIGVDGHWGSYVILPYSIDKVSCFLIAY